MAGFGSGLGDLVGGILGRSDIAKAQDAANQRTAAGITNVNSIQSGFNASTQPYNTFGQSFLPEATAGVGEVQDAARGTQGYNQFMSSYTNTPAVQYQLQQADAVQNNSAAARGGVLSGANERALGTINTGIVSQGANTAYNEYLQGNNQPFGQLETALGNMFRAISVGETATGQQAGVATAGMGATAGLANANVNATSYLGGKTAETDKSIGSGLGSMFAGLGSMNWTF